MLDNSDKIMKLNEFTYLVTKVGEKLIEYPATLVRRNKKTNIAETISSNDIDDYDWTFLAIAETFVQINQEERLKEFIDLLKNRAETET